jgi:carbon storage regulator
MLVLSRRLHETIVINNNIRVEVMEIHGRRVRLGIDAPGSVTIWRQELCDPAGARARSLRRDSRD